MTEVPPARPAPAGFPPSPCTLVCTLDERNVCLGCRRTLDEITAWAGMTAGEQREVLRQLPDRRE